MTPANRSQSLRADSPQRAPSNGVIPSPEGRRPFLDSNRHHPGRVQDRSRRVADLWSTIAQIAIRTLQRVPDRLRSPVSHQYHRAALPLRLGRELLHRYRKTLLVQSLYVVWRTPCQTPVASSDQFSIRATPAKPSGTRAGKETCRTECKTQPRLHFTGDVGLGATAMAEQFQMKVDIRR